MKKFAIFCGTIVASVLIAGVYGILHNQVTYSISAEYFTKFKYQQFGVEPEFFGGDRETVAVIGFLATWWTGIFIGLGLGITALIFKDHNGMRMAIQKAILVVLYFTVAMGVFGLVYGRFGLTESSAARWLPEDVIDRNAFATVGSIHNFSYAGGILGLIAGIYYLIKRKKLESVT